MASLESRTCECICEQKATGGFACVCTVPCAFNSEGKIVNWTCECKCSEGEKAFSKCTFQVRCNNQDKPCPADDTELFAAKCTCGNLVCSLQIRKCRGCEIIKAECESPESGCCKSETSDSATKKCCKGGQC